jgi:hypothetical protein
MQENIYPHRRRKVQDEDDIMICQCKPIWATDTTTIGCGEGCLNRMLNIECVVVSATACPSSPPQHCHPPARAAGPAANCSSEPPRPACAAGLLSVCRALQ